MVCAEPLQWVAVGHCDHKEASLQGPQVLRRGSLFLADPAMACWLVSCGAFWPGHRRRRRGRAGAACASSGVRRSRGPVRDPSPSSSAQVCWKCVVKMRFVQKDKKCCICKQELEMVYCTRALGSYTPSFG